MRKTFDFTENQNGDFVAPTDHFLFCAICLCGQGSRTHLPIGRRKSFVLSVTNKNPKKKGWVKSTLGFSIPYLFIGAKQKRVRLLYDTADFVRRVFGQDVWFKLEK